MTLDPPSWRTHDVRIYLPEMQELLFFCWSIVDLQYQASLCCIARWLSYIHIYVFINILFHCGLPRDSEYTSLCSTLGPCCLSILNVIAYIYQLHTFSPSVFLLLPWQPQVWSLRLRIYFCFMLCYAKSLQSCPTLCDPIDGSPPGSPVPGILQARTLEWVAISFIRAIF